MGVYLREFCLVGFIRGSFVWWGLSEGVLSGEVYLREFCLVGVYLREFCLVWFI